MIRFAAIILISGALLCAFTPSIFAETKRAKVIDFDDEVVEGLNKKPLDSLNEISERDRRHKKPHLYRKRAGFRPEVAETVRMLPNAP
ncbi:MAG: hypothetical protein P4M08_08420 [Oligoflexia bacterium]|nr:hypothetical protein [Oligoflexia bacterium]